MQLHAPHVVKISDVVEQPWKNGGGTTRLIAAGSGWRISIATVAAPGSFSLFEHCTRQSVVVAGDGLTLKAGSSALSLSPHEIVNYPGDVEWFCTVEGRPASVLNVICDDRLVRASIRKVTAASIEAGDYAAMLPVNCDATCEAQTPSERLAIPMGQVLVWERPRSTCTCRAGNGRPDAARYLLAIQIKSATVTTGSCS